MHRSSISVEMRGRTHRPRSRIAKSRSALRASFEKAHDVLTIISTEFKTIENAALTGYPNGIIGQIREIQAKFEAVCHPELHIDKEREIFCDSQKSGSSPTMQRISAVADNLVQLWLTQFDRGDVNHTEAYASVMAKYAAQKALSVTT